MRPLVGEQIGGGQKSLIADGTLIWSFARMHSHVVLKELLGAECLVAHSALESLGTWIWIVISAS